MDDCRHEHNHVARKNYEGVLLYRCDDCGKLIARIRRGYKMVWKVLG